MNDIAITLIPVNVYNAEHEIVFGNQWLHSEHSVLYAYGLEGNKTTITKVFEYPILDYRAETANGNVAHVFTVDTSVKYGIIELVAVKTGGCGCSDPRKTITSATQMDALITRTAERSDRQNIASAAAEQRRAIARQRAVTERGQRFERAQSARAAAKAAQK